MFATASILGCGAGRQNHDFVGAGDDARLSDVADGIYNPVEGYAPEADAQVIEEVADSRGRAAGSREWTYKSGNRQYVVKITYGTRDDVGEDKAGATGRVKGLHVLALSRWGNDSCDNLSTALNEARPAELALAVVPYWNPGNPFGQLTRVLKRLDPSIKLYLTLFATYHAPYDPQKLSIQTSARGIARFLRDTLSLFPNVVPTISPSLEDEYNSDDNALRGFADLVFGLYEGFSKAPTVTSLSVKRSYMVSRGSLKGVLKVTITPKKPQRNETVWNVSLNLQHEYHLNFDSNKTDIAYSNDGQFVYDPEVESPISATTNVPDDGTQSNANSQSLADWKGLSDSDTLFYLLWRPKYNLWPRAKVTLASSPHKGKYRYVKPSAKVWTRTDPKRDDRRRPGDDIAFNQVEVDVLKKYLRSRSMS